MPAWGDYVSQLEAIPREQYPNFLRTHIESKLKEIGEILGCPNVILYASSFLQKPEVPFHAITLTKEDINGFMNAVYGMTDDKLILILHTPGEIFTLRIP